MDLAAARDELADRLATIGIRAVTEPRKILAPCALIEIPATVRLTALGPDCSAVVAVTVTLIAPANDPDWLMANVIAAMGAVGCVESSTVQFSMGDDAVLPAYALPVILTVKES
jgi:hypothetical protein